MNSGIFNAQAKIMALLIVCGLSFSSGHAQKLKDKLQFGGKESSLKDKKIQSLSMIAENNPALTPGSSFQVGMIAVTDDGKEMKTKGLADGKVRWDNYTVSVTGGSFSDGSVTIDRDPRKIPGYKILVKIALTFDTAQFKTMEFSLSFKANYVAYFNGHDGEAGKVGTKGDAGSKGTDNLSGTGGDGGNGGNGQPGGQGGNGENGQAVDVYVTAFKDASGTTLLKVYCKSRTSDHEEFFIVDPSGGSITISARGGQGGNGGPGGDAGKGGEGGHGHQYGGNPSDNKNGVGGNGGNGGSGGNAGAGGNGGNGGNITVYFDPSASAYQQIFTFNTNGGSNGSTGGYGAMGSCGYGGIGDTQGKAGTNGKNGEYAGQGKDGSNGPKPTILVQKVEIDWDKVAR